MKKVLTAASLGLAILVSSCGMQEHRGQTGLSATGNSIKSLSCDNGAMILKLIDANGVSRFSEATIKDANIVRFFASKGVKAAGGTIYLNGVPVIGDSILPFSQLAGAGRQSQRYDAFIFGDGSGVKIQFKQRAEKEFFCDRGGKLQEGFCVISAHGNDSSGIPRLNDTVYRARSGAITPEREVANWFFQSCK